MAKVVKPLTRSKIRKIIRQKIKHLEQRADESDGTEGTDEQEQEQVVKQKDKKKQSIKLNGADSIDLLVYLNYTIFLKELIRQAKIVQIKENSAELNPVQLNNIKNNILRKFRG